MKKFHITTFGCQMNKHDSERMAGLLTDIGYAQAENADDAQILIFNTCTVREHAEDRFFGNLNNLRSRKKSEPDLIIAVGGCVAQDEKELIFKKAPHVDIVFGTLNMPNLGHMIESVERRRESICEIADKIEIMPTTMPSLREEAYHAWIPIIIGCNNFCSYCIVPYTRGREASRTLEDIHAEVERLISDGVIEITLLGQNVNSYGRDLYGESSFARLLTDLNGIAGLRRIRFTTSHPKDLTDDIIDAIAHGDKICEHIHLPVQAGSNTVLKVMNRKYTKEKYLETVEKIYEAIPGVSLTTDIMVGYPGETEEDFLHTLDIVEKARYDSAFTFIFSPREGTPAANMENRVTADVKADRFDRLIKLQNRISLEKNKELVGRDIEVFIEGVSKKNRGVLTGRTRTNKIVNFPGSQEFVHSEALIYVTDAHTWSLSGELKKILDT
ncbi:MAG: tRNA (N6-isopentenyl adenosine(37)-C2)-methylthiotransferase MiaB [Candidatus Aquicultor secundus]|uniref:tRNA (N6-isopentenyl adenosine(37)-C2)-methylthiotransferase MiaB n=2 Tax=Candidatus Aquicultor secundus TaxID=1973895 RepID=UPI000922DFCE|nr:tRNA (N6-isopentenyl adenosine(37)-C2)-methylthiotransferase MiaB [Candidatus Aquicultor secundus]NCO65130.1 tRNA (N6-isopentenyl adenosine(37)-C2)-methylthiotransferase MiaB [Solirubrobacter sp.]OIO83641.1 MAG: tRNA (N6-isopentenyl adenosine(37)-C2)-methylthiotransferase MiaB [Candidatus Aquicultor secundus]PIU27809.1 MAG: tRNA (N6-isopentenyl adenosine(37)-C2)-methylthiotransferase MiaB [Candidatus Aquicultor secundus]PIW21265.1 MAG: tRNA (N6-isopentenyl adenosine(37)-C2)-methylthiotransfe